MRIWTSISLILFVLIDFEIEREVPGDIEDIFDVRYTMEDPEKTLIDLAWEKRSCSFQQT
jgi:hypothetical protein